MTVARARARYGCSMAPRLLSVLFYTVCCIGVASGSPSSISRAEAACKACSILNAGLQNVRRPTPAARQRVTFTRPSQGAPARRVLLTMAKARPAPLERSELVSDVKCPVVP